MAHLKKKAHLTGAGPRLDCPVIRLSVDSTQSDPDEIKLHANCN